MQTDNPQPNQDIGFDETKPLGPQVAQLPEKTIHQLISQASAHADYTKYTKLMNDLAQRMCIQPHLKSDIPDPTDTNALIKVEFPKEGGVLTYMENYEFPFKGYPHFEFVEKVDMIKKVNRSFLSGVYHQFKDTPKWKLFTVIPALWVTKKALRAWTHAFYRYIERFIIKEDKYCVSVRELRRAFTATNNDNSEFHKQVRDFLCMILELDNAYRFRMQDIVVELNKDTLRKQPITELLRLLSIMQSREKTQEIKDTWKLVKYFIAFYLRFDKKLQRIIVNSLLEADIEKIRLDTGDKFYCVPRVDYTFGFQLSPQDEDLKIIEMNTLKESFKEKSKAIRNESSKAHKELEGADKSDIELADKKYQTLLDNESEKYKSQKQEILKNLINQPI